MAASSLGASLLAAQDVLEAMLQEVDAAALCQLKAVSVAWCTQARRELCNRLCRREGQPETAGVAGITDLDVAVLNDAGRPWEVVVAGRQLPQLARLHGFGFVVDVQAVREADLDSEEDDDDEEEDDDAPLGGAALRSCIEGEGEPPRELLLAAVACAASDTVYGVPVQVLREDDAIGSLDLEESGIGIYGAGLLGLMLPVATSVHSLSIGNNSIGAEGASALAAILKETMITTLSLAGNRLCGLDNHGRGTYTSEGITKLCEALKGSAVTSLNIGRNFIRAMGASALAAVLKETNITELNLGCNQIGDEGASALAAILKETQITNLRVGFNEITGDAANHLATVVLEHAIMTDFCGIPLASLRENSITELDLPGAICKGFGVPGAIVLSKLLPSAAALTSLSLSYNVIGGKGASMLAAILKETQITKLNLGGNQLCGLDNHGRGTYTSEGITKLCEGLKGSAVTSLDLYHNHIGDKGASALAAILKETQITNLGLRGNNIGAEGASALAAILKETQITNLDLERNGIGYEGASALAAILKETKITTAGLNLQINLLDDQAKQAINDALGSRVFIVL